MADIWIISDTHFNHENILGFKDKGGKLVRPFSDVHDMNETMIDRWNKLVKVTDKVYHLGDVIFGNRLKDGPRILSRLNGHKRLIVGNHDVIYGQTGELLHRYFKRIYMWRMMPEHNILMTHVPVHPSTLGEVFRFEAAKEKMTNVHGHIHQNSSPEGPYFCACVEHLDYMPINLDELKRRIK